MQSYRSATPFFHDPRVHRAISRIAAADRVVIYCGAGLTIDRAGVGWGPLLRDALKHPSLIQRVAIDPAEVDVIGRHLEPLTIGTIASYYFDEVHGKAANPNAGKSALVYSLRGQLYDGSSWQSGRLTINVIRTAAYLVRSGVDVEIATTNYDTFIEDEFEVYQSLGPREAKDVALDVEVLGAPVRSIGPEKPPYRMKLVYLHGRIPEVGVPDGIVAVSEHDYYVLRSDVEDRLCAMFTGPEDEADSANPHRRPAVLILGSSVTDPPLLSALEATQIAGPVPPRIALTPTPGYGFEDVTTHDVNVLKRYLGARMKAFGVDLLFPDFFYQSAQFLDEIMTAGDLVDDPPNPNTGYRSADAASFRYGARLGDWWSLWEKSNVLQGAAGSSRTAHEVLSRQLEELERLLLEASDSSSEPVALEVFVRWNPTSGANRFVRRWASTKAVMSDPTSSPAFEFETDSGVSGVEALVSGRPRLHRGTSDNLSGDESTYLSVPIRFAHQYGLVPVGAVTLSSPWAADKSRIMVSNADSLRQLVAALADVGQSILFAS